MAELKQCNIGSLTTASALEEAAKEANRYGRERASDGKDYKAFEKTYLKAKFGIDPSSDEYSRVPKLVLRKLKEGYEQGKSRPIQVSDDDDSILG